MTRSTSIEAYNSLVASGILTVRQGQVFEVLYPDGPLGSREVWEEIKKIHPKIPQHSINPRFKELVRMGVVEQVGEHECPYTNSTVKSWDVTSLNNTSKFVPDPTKGDLLRESIEKTIQKHGDKKVSCEKLCGIILARMDKLGL